MHPCDPKPPTPFTSTFPVYQTQGVAMRLLPEQVMKILQVHKHAQCHKQGLAHTQFPHIRVFSLWPRQMADLSEIDSVAGGRWRCELALGCAPLLQSRMVSEYHGISVITQCLSVTVINDAPTKIFNSHQERAQLAAVCLRRRGCHQHIFLWMALRSADGPERLINEIL